jgi:hypothetical protein
MDLPFEFPSETELILEDVARFRALMPVERFRSLRGLLNAGDLILKQSQGGLGQAVRRRAGGPRATGHPGVLLAPWILTKGPFREGQTRGPLMSLDCQNR